MSFHESWVGAHTAGPAEAVSAIRFKGTLDLRPSWEICISETSERSPTPFDPIAGSNKVFVAMFDRHSSSLPCSGYGNITHWQKIYRKLNLLYQQLQNIFHADVRTEENRSKLQNAENSGRAGDAKRTLSGHPVCHPRRPNIKLLTQNTELVCGP